MYVCATQSTHLKFNFEVPFLDIGTSRANWAFSSALKDSLWHSAYSIPKSCALYFATEEVLPECLEISFAAFVIQSLQWRACRTKSSRPRYGTHRIPESSTVRPTGKRNPNNPRAQRPSVTIQNQSRRASIFVWAQPGHQCDLVECPWAMDSTLYFRI